MSGEDAGFLHLDLPVQPMNTMALAVLAPPVDESGTPQPITLEYLRGHMAERLGELPSFRWRVERVPFGLHHPVYIEDPDFDLDYHLREATLPAPGTAAQLDELMAAHAELHLDRRHPLWQLTLVSGLASGRQAVICRFHHCLMDGVAALTTFGRVFSGLDHELAAPPEPWAPERVPRKSRLVADALKDHGRTVRRLPGLGLKTKRNFAAVKAFDERSPVKVPKPLVDTVPCSLNDAFTIARAWTGVDLAMRDVKLVKDAAGVSLNDVVLGVTAGALRQYLDERGELPDAPLTASVPVGFEPPGAPTRQFGNRFSSLTTSLATDIADPWERLQEISRVMIAAKEALDLLGPELMPDWLECVPPFVAEPAVRSHNKARREKRDEADVNVLISNLRGPATRWHLGPALVEDLYLSGPPSNGVGSNVMVWSYADRLMFGIRSFADSLVAPERLAAALRDSLAELVAESRSREGTTEAAETGTPQS